MAHDYRISSEISSFCMNEVLMGMPIPTGFMSNFKVKLNPLVVREIILIGKKFNSKDAL